MKFLKSILLPFILLLTYSTTFAACDDIWDINCSESIPYCDEYDSSGNNLCGLDEGVRSIDGEIDALVYDRPLSEYIQDVVTYLLTFITIISVLFIMYAGFNILIGGGDEEKIKKSKNIIIYVLLGIIVMWLAFSIVTFVINAIDR